MAIDRVGNDGDKSGIETGAKAEVLFADVGDRDSVVDVSEDEFEDFVDVEAGGIIEGEE